MMLILVYFFSLFQISRAQISTSCYTCASLDLKSKWYLTGLAPVQDSFFVTNCARAPGANNREQCSGPCYTMAFDDPDEVGTSTTPTTYVVRGCHRTLTNVITDRIGNSAENSGNKESDFCEIDNSYKMADRKGNTVAVRFLSKFCSGQDLCNDDDFSGADFTTSITCNNQTNDNLLNSNPLNCYDCTPSESSNCHESKCTKKYCSRQEVRLGNGFQVMKTCSNVNILGVDNQCQTFDVFTNPGGVPVKNLYSQCYCKDRQFCNSAEKVGIFGIFLVFLSIFNDF